MQTLINIYNKIKYSILKKIYSFNKYIEIKAKNLIFKTVDENSEKYYKNLEKFGNHIEGGEERITNSILDKTNLKYFNIENNDSFLDIGCGNGKNLHAVKKNFPNSKLYGCDIHSRCIEKYPELKTNFKLINLRDKNCLSSYSSKSIDHVYIMHTLNHVFLDTEEKTNELRKNLINDMIRISKKNVFLVDAKSYLGDRNSNSKIYFSSNKFINKIEVNYNLRNLLNEEVKDVQIYFTKYNSTIFRIVKESI